MTDYSELKKAAEAFLESPSGMNGVDSDFRVAANPTAVLGLIAEIEQLRPDAERYRFIKPDEQMALVEDLAYNVPDVEWDAAIDAAMSKEAAQ